MSNTGDLDSLLFDEDDSDHDTTRSVNLNSTTPLPPPVSTTTTPSASANTVHRLFGILQQQLAPDVFAQLTAELKKTPDQKQILNIVKQYTGPELFDKVLLEIRDQTTSIPMPVSTAPALNGALAPPADILTPPAAASVPLAAPTTIAAVPTPPPQTTPAPQNSAKMFMELFIHASSCTLPDGTCPRNKCGVFKKLIAHARSCNKVPNCDNCRKVLSLSRAHAQKCTEVNCNVVFCDTIRKRTAGSTMMQSSSSVVKQEAANGSTTSGMVNAAQVTTAPAAASISDTATKFAEALRVILHVKKCTANPCPVGETCDKGKLLWAQAQQLLQNKTVPNLLPGAKSYKEVVVHYNSCSKKSTCPVCRNSHVPLPAANAVSKRPAPDSSSSTQPVPKKAKVAKPVSKPVASVTASVQDLVSIGNNDVRKESDLLVHTFVDLAEERRRMLMMAAETLDPELRKQSDELNCKKEEWATNNFFSSAVLEGRMRAIAQKHGIGMATNITECLSRALQGYIKKVLTEVIMNGANRCNARIKQQRNLIIQKEPNSLDLTTEAYRQNLLEQRHHDIELRRILLSEAEKQESLERERSKKRKKSDKTKPTSTTDDEKSEYDMDIEELSVKDLKTHLLAQRQRGLPLQEYPVEFSRSRTMVPQPPNQVVVDDIINWLRKQRSTHPRLFCRADMALIMANKK